MTIERSNLLFLTRIFVLTLGVYCAASISAEAQSTPVSGPLPLMDREKEIALALSACPASIVELPEFAPDTSTQTSPIQNAMRKRKNMTLPIVSPADCPPP